MKVNQTDCIVCVSNGVYKVFRLCQPFLQYDCQHKNKNLKQPSITLSRFWSNIQLLFLITWLIAFRNTFKALSVSTGIETVKCMMRIFILFGFNLHVWFLTTQKCRLKEMLLVQSAFGKMSDLRLPSLLPETFLKRFRFWNNVIIILEFVFFMACACYVSYKMYVIEEYAVWTIEFLNVFVAPNIFFFYSYTYYLATVAYKKASQDLMNFMKLRFVDDTIPLSDLLRKYIDAKKVICKAIHTILQYREGPILDVVMVVVVLSVGSCYIFIVYTRYILDEDILFKFFQSYNLLLHICVMCVLASRLPEEVSIKLIIYHVSDKKGPKL